MPRGRHDWSSLLSGHNGMPVVPSCRVDALLGPTTSVWVDQAAANVRPDDVAVLLRAVDLVATPALGYGVSDPGGCHFSQLPTLWWRGGVPYPFPDEVPGESLPKDSAPKPATSVVVVALHRVYAKVAGAAAADGKVLLRRPRPRQPARSRAGECRSPLVS